jgi:hypothetical protein
MYYDFAGYAQNQKKKVMSRQEASEFISENRGGLLAQNFMSQFQITDDMFLIKETDEKRIADYIFDNYAY